MLKFLNKYCHLDLFLPLNILATLLFLTFTRILIYFFNPDLFIIDNGLKFIEVILYGLRFDLSTLFVVNSLYIILLLQPINFNKYVQSFIRIFVFFIPNAIALATNLVDLVYIRFTLKRTTADVFGLVSSLQKEMGGLITAFISDYFFIFIIGLSIIIAFIITNQYIYKHTKTFKIKVKYKIILLIVSIVVSIMGIRGGLQLKPISIITAAKYTNSQNIALITNTPFTIIKTINKKTIEQFDFFEKKELKQIFNPLKQASNKTLQKHNFVIIILESFSNKYTNVFKDKANTYTPFLDSLAKHSLYFPNMYANGKRSIEALPAIVLGIPSLSNTPFIQSSFAGNNSESTINILKNLGYKSAFYHGGNNGTMGFDDFVKYAGFDNYWGRNEYNNDADFDGKWGIFDHKFYEFYAKQYAEKQSPFIDVIFSLSSHHPYKIHPDYEEKIHNKQTKTQRAIMYADLSLKHLFEMIKKTKQFDNTIFIITADHTSEEIKRENEAYSIPLLIYSSKRKYIGVSKKITQQIDIKPLIFSIINYNQLYYSLGNNPLDSNTNSFAVYYNYENYSFVFKNHSYVFNEESIKLDSNKQNKDIKLIKAFLQTYSNDLITNKMNTLKR